MKALLVFLASATALCARFEPGVLPPSWRSSGPVCEAVPDWQVHEYNSDFWILRESGGINYEKPFLYLIFGVDTGAGEVKTAAFVPDSSRNGRNAGAEPRRGLW